MRFPQEATIQFNLGCYASPLGDLEEAKRRVTAAVDLEPGYRLHALDDEDLKPLRDELAVILKNTEA